jgi:hypothetical protein
MGLGLNQVILLVTCRKKLLFDYLFTFNSPEEETKAQEGRSYNSVSGFRCAFAPRRLLLLSSGLLIHYALPGGRSRQSHLPLD